MRSCREKPAVVYGNDKRCTLGGWDGMELSSPSQTVCCHVSGSGVIFRLYFGGGEGQRTSSLKQYILASIGPLQRGWLPIVIMGTQIFFFMVARDC